MPSLTLFKKSCKANSYFYVLFCDNGKDFSISAKIKFIFVIFRGTKDASDFRGPNLIRCSADTMGDLNKPPGCRP